MANTPQCNCNSDQTAKSPIDMVEEQIQGAITDIDAYLENSYYVTLDQLDDLSGVKEELETAKSSLEDAHMDIDKIQSAIQEGKDAGANADYYS